MYYMTNNNLTNNILISNLIADFNPKDLAKGIASRVRTRRLELNLTQAALAKKSGVSLGSLQRFENQAEISLKSLLKLAVALNATAEFKNLFSVVNYQHIEDVIASQQAKTRKRGRKND